MEKKAEEIISFPAIMEVLALTSPALLSGYTLHQTVRWLGDNAPGSELFRAYINEYNARINGYKDS